MTIPDWLWHWSWHGLRGAILAGVPALVATVKGSGNWPTPVDWLIIGAAALLGFVNGADSFRTDPT